jgi:hypothetical protein
VGKSAAKRLVAELGPDPPMDFKDMENFATLTAAGVTEGAIATLLKQKAQGLAQSPCPALV